MQIKQAETFNHNNTAKLLDIRLDQIKETLLHLDVVCETADENQLLGVKDFLDKKKAFLTKSLAEVEENTLLEPHKEYFIQKIRNLKLLINDLKSDYLNTLDLVDLV